MKEKIKKIITPFFIIVVLIVSFFLYVITLTLIFGETLNKGLELFLIMVLLISGLLTGYLWNEGIINKEEDDRYSFKETAFYYFLGIISVIFWIAAIFLAIQD